MAATKLQEGLRNLAGKVDRKFSNKEFLPNAQQSSKQDIQKLKIQISGFSAKENEITKSIKLIQNYINLEMKNYAHIQDPGKRNAAILKNDNIKSLARTKKQKEGQLVALRTSRISLEEHLNALQTASITKATINAIKLSSASLKSASASLKIEELENIGDDLKEGMDDILEFNSELNSTLQNSNPVTGLEDDDGLLEYLSEDPDLAVGYIEPTPMENVKEPKTIVGNIIDELPEPIVSGQISTLSSQKENFTSTMKQVNSTPEQIMQSIYIPNNNNQQIGNVRRLNSNKNNDIMSALD